MDQENNPYFVNPFSNVQIRFPQIIEIHVRKAKAILVSNPSHTKSFTVVVSDKYVNSSFLVFYRNNRNQSSSTLNFGVDDDEEEVDYYSV